MATPKRGGSPAPHKKAIISWGRGEYQQVNLFGDKKSNPSKYGSKRNTRVDVRAFTTLLPSPATKVVRRALKNARLRLLVLTEGFELALVAVLDRCGPVP